jgi:hypothetical protein
MAAYPDRLGLKELFADVFELSPRTVVRIEPAPEQSGACPLRWDRPRGAFWFTKQDPAEEAT